MNIRVPFKRTFRSFSFRSGLLIYVALSIVFTAQHVIIYQQSLEKAWQDTRDIIESNAVIIDQGMERYGLKYVRSLVPAILEDTRDRHFYLLLREGNRLIGNLSAWPEAIPTGKKNLEGWHEIEAAQNIHGGPAVVKLLVKVVPYKGRADLLIGYDLHRVEGVRHAVVRALVTNTFLSLVLSLLLSIGIVMLINKELMGINRTCNAVIAGRLSRRVPVREANDQFDELGLNINRMLDWINTLVESVKDSANAIAHDMRTPLSRLRLELRTLADDEETPQDMRRKLAKSVRRIDALAEMSDNILKIAKAESRAGTEMFEPFDLSAVTRDILEFYQALIEEKHQVLTSRISEEKMILNGDEQMVKQAFVNLIDNAVKFTPKGGHISVSLEALQGIATLTVADTGSGIADEDRERVKERFFRTDKSRHTPGTGLGLSLVNAVAGLHQGGFELYNNNPGLRAVLTFPLESGKQLSE